MNGLRMKAVVVALVTAVTIIAVRSADAVVTNLWTFDTDFFDSAGEASGTAVVGAGTVTISTAANEYLLGGGGLRIEHGGGGGDYVDIAMPVFSPDVFSINLFYRMDESFGTIDARPFLFETVPNFSVGMGLRDASGAMDTEWFFAGGPQDITGPITNDGNWHQATLVWDKTGSNTVSYYHDGTLRDQVDLGAAVFDNAGQANGLHIGNHRTGDGTRNWNGFIDEFAIYNDALDETDVAALYMSAFGTAPPNPDQPAIDAIQFSAPAGTTVEYDFIGWNAATYTDGPGATDDLGDGGFMGGSYLRTQGSGNNTLEITITDLPDHNFVDIGGILAQLDSLDPVRDGDRFRVEVDGVEVFNHGFGYGVSGLLVEPLYTDADGNEIPLPAGARTLADSNVFVDLADFNENMYELGAFSELQGIAHTGSSLTLTIIGFQNQATGEFYGLDKLSVEVGVIPEPSSVVLGLGALVALGLFRRLRG